MSRLDDQCDASDEVGGDTGLARRKVLTAGAGFALAASGLLPPGLPETEAHPVKGVGNRAAKRRQRRRHHLAQRRRRQRRQSGGNSGHNPGSGNVVLARGVYL
jgi:hypothetical protein